jgi:monoamine oxidase
MSRDVLVLGAGLAGLAAARDLAAGGADVEVLEARDRPGGRVEQAVLDDGRALQLGGELIGSFHTAYLGLAAELGLVTEPSYVAEPGAMSWDLAEGPGQGEWPPGFTEADVADAQRVEAACVRLAATVDPADPWGHPDAAALDAISFAGWLRAEGARPAVLRLYELGALALAGGSTERVSLLGQLRAISAAGATEVYGYERWEGLRLAAGSAALPLALAADLGDRVRLGATVRALHVGRAGVEATLDGGEVLRAEAVVCALPVGPLRAVRVSGVSDARLASLHRQRQALAAKVVAAYPAPIWRDAGASGLCDGEGLVSSTWPQGNDALSMLIAPERLAHFLAAPPDARRAEVLAHVAGLYGEAARAPDAYLERAWGVDPLTQGYVAQWAPGDLTAVGPLHGTHEPPFYVAGSDHWVVGYMEGAVRTGRDAARAALTAAPATRAPAARSGRPRGRS